MGDGKRLRAADDFRVLTLKLTQLGDMADGVFGSLRPGWVVMAANDAGRQAIDAMFPGCMIRWTREDRAPGNFLPVGWHHFEINLPEVIAHCPDNRLPKHYRDVDMSINDCNGYQLATLMALGVKHAGLRAATLDSRGKCNIYPPANDTH
jgi:hypothetical protein